MDPQMLQMIMGGAGGPNDPRVNQLTRQQKLADMLRLQGLQGVEGRNVGNTFVSSGAGGLAQQIMSGMMGEHMTRQNDKQAASLSGEQGAGRMRNLDALIMALRRQIPQSNTAMLPPDGMEDQ